MILLFAYLGGILTMEFGTVASQVCTNSCAMPAAMASGYSRSPFPTRRRRLHHRLIGNEENPRYRP